MRRFAMHRLVMGAMLSVVLPSVWSAGLGDTPQSSGHGPVLGHPVVKPKKMHAQQKRLLGGERLGGPQTPTPDPDHGGTSDGPHDPPHPSEPPKPQE